MAFSVAFSVKCQQLHPDPDLGPLKHDHKLTLIFFSLHESDLPNPWIKRGDPSVNWPRDWLPKEEEGLGDNILVLSVQCFVEPKTQCWKPLEEILVRDLVMNTNWELDRTQTIVLVGHGLGGLVIKSLTIEVDKLSKTPLFNEKSPEVRWKAFKQNIKGIVFYSVPHTTFEQEFVNYCKSYTMMIQYVDDVQVFKHFNQDMVLLNVGFEKSIAQHTKLFAFVEGQKVMVPQSSTYKLVQNNVCEIEDADHFQVSQPLDHQHASCKRLLQFIQEDLLQVSQPLDQQHVSYRRLLQFIREDLLQVCQPLDQQHASYEQLLPFMQEDLLQVSQPLDEQHASYELSLQFIQEDLLQVSQRLDQQHASYERLLQFIQEDLLQVSQPLDQQHVSYRRLLQFIREGLLQVSQRLDQRHVSYTRWLQFIQEDLFQLFQHLDQQHASYERLLQFIQEDLLQVSQPLDQQHASYERLLQFIQEDLLQVSQPLDQQHVSYMRLLQFKQEDLGQTLKPYLPREAKQEVETRTRTNETKGVPNRQQKLDVMIRTIEDVHIKSPKDLQCLAPEEVLGETSILCVGGKVEEGDLVEFLFMDAGDMAKVVGVGFNWAKVVVTKEFGVNVEQVDEDIWTNLWCLEHFVPRIITIPNPKQELMTHPNSAKTDGVELEANLGRVYVEDEKEKNAHACFPLVFELAEHIGFGREKAMKMKEVSGEGSSGSTKDGSQ